MLEYFHQDYQMVDTHSVESLKLFAEVISDDSFCLQQIILVYRDKFRLITVTKGNIGIA